MKKLTKTLMYVLTVHAIVILLVLAFSPATSHAGGFFNLDFIGEGVKAWKDAEWKKLLIISIRDSMTSWILITAMVGGVISAVAIGMLAHYYAKVLLATMRDNTITKPEMVVIILASVVIVAAFSVLWNFARLFLRASEAGLMELVGS